MKIKSLQPSVQNTKLISFGGEAINVKDGIAEVSEEFARILADDENWELVDELPEKEKVSEEAEQMIEVINNSTLEELIELAKQSNVQGYQLFSKPEKIENLRKLLIKKLISA